MPLTDVFIRSLKPLEKPYKHFDGGGLHIHVTPNGSKLWRMSYRFDGKGKLLSFGEYPTVSLKDAREKREEAKKLLAQGIDPSVWKKQEKAARRIAQRDTFENIAREWYDTRTVHLTERYRHNLLRRFENHVFPKIGKTPITQLEISDILDVVKPVEQEGHVATARFILQSISQIFRYAVLSGRARHNIASDLQGVLRPVQSSHRATITNAVEVGELLRRIDAYEGYFPQLCALKLAPLVFTRPVELLGAEWKEFDLGAREWRIPAERMKMKRPHIVPLSEQALAIIKELETITGAGRYLFPAARDPEKHIKGVRIFVALRSLGYTKDELCFHGFRAMASTLLNERGYNRDWIERQLAHCPRDSVRAAYNYAEYLPERRRMMQEWADYLTSLKNKEGKNDE